MSFLPEVSEDRATGQLSQSYSAIRQECGFILHFWQAQGTRPEILQANLELWRLIYRTGVLPATLKEEMLLVVSAANTDSYCVVAHLEMLRMLGVDKAVGRQIIRDYEAAAVPEREKALFRFAEKVTREPFRVKEADISELRRHGWDDAAILEASLVASHANYLNRLAAALGLVPDDVF